MEEWGGRSTPEEVQLGAAARAGAHRRPLAPVVVGKLQKGKMRGWSTQSAEGS